MPIYTVRNQSTEEYYDVNMPWKESQQFLQGNPELRHIPKMPATVTGRMSTHRMAGQEWQDVLKKVKKASGKNAKINV